MSGCHHHSVIDLYFAEYGEVGLILTLFLNGLAGSFVHCIPMCGSIALCISNARLMHIKQHEMDERIKIKYIFAAPYYVGKTITYTTLAGIFFALKQTFQTFFLAKILGFALLVLTAISFIIMAIGGSVNIKIFKSKKYEIFERFVTNWSKKYFSFFGFKGLLYGMILGLIPCGLVYTSIITAEAYAPNIYILIISVAVFGLSTIPGLFLTAYFGNFIMSIRGKKLVKLLFSSLMLFNSYLLISYALKLL